MDIDRCNSIFELFAAFNFTYAILSDISDEEDTEKNTRNSYVDIIDNRLLKSFSKFLKKGKNLRSRINTRINTITTLEDRFLNNAELGDLKSKYEGIKKTSELLIIEVEAAKETEREYINAIFPFLSFYLATFCIAVLGLAISQSGFKHFSLFLLVLMTCCVYLYILRKKKENNHFKLARIVLWKILFISIIHSLISNFYLKLDNNIVIYFVFFDSNQIAKMILIFISILLPFSHFIYFFFSISNSNTKIEKEWFRTAQTCETQYEDYCAILEKKFG